MRKLSLQLMMFIVIAGGVVFLFGCGKTGSDEAAVERHKKLAGELKDNKLYEAAIEEYQKLLARDDIDTVTRANINYLIAKIYYENLNDYPNAAAYYLRARAINPNGSFVEEASRKLVASLEKMGHLVDAKRQLAAATDIDTTAHDKNDVIVAKVGGVPIWRSEVEEQIQALPPEMQKQFLTKKAKIQFMHNYVAAELLYRAAIREDYGNDPEVQKKQRQLYKKLLIDKYVVEKVMPQVHIDSADVYNYYVAHKDDRYHGAPFDSVRATVFLDYQGEKTESAFNDYISRLAKVEKVEFYDENMQ